MTSNESSADAGGSHPRPVTMDMIADYFRRHGVGWFDEDDEWHSGDRPRESQPPGRHVIRYGRETVYRRARAYVAKCPEAVSGQRGHSAAFRVACELVLGFNLSVAEAMPIFQEYNRRCQPSWSDKEVLHKLRSADQKPGQRGYRLNWKETEPVRDPLPDWVADHEKELDEAAGNDAADGGRAAPAFPLDAFTPRLQRYAAAVANAVGCPVDFPAAAMVAVAATCAGNSRALAVKRKWVEAPRFYVAVVAEPGAAKTPALSAVCGPVYAAQRRWKQDYDRQLHEYEEQAAAWETWKKRGCKGPQPEQPRRPAFRHLYTTDATTEKLAQDLSENPRGFAMIRDEISAWVLSMNQYKAGGKGSDRQFYLSAWSGENVKVDRKNQEKGPLIVPHPFLNILGGIQPDMLAALRDEEHREDGFVHRLLFAYPESSPPNDWTEQDVPAEVEDVWEQVCEWLLGLQMDSGEEGEVRPKLVRFTEDAKGFWVTWYNQHVAEMREEDFPPFLAGPWSKMRSYAARLCLVVHLLRSADGEVSCDDVDGISAVYGCLIAEYFKGHARRVFDQLYASKFDNKADKAIAWVRKRGGRVTARDVVQSRIAGCRRTSDARDLFKDLADRGYGQSGESDPDDGGHPVHWFQANDAPASVVTLEIECGQEDGSQADAE